MPEGLVRLHHSGQAHFLTFSCCGRRPLLAEMRMEPVFLQVLEHVRRSFRMYVWGYVVMPEHAHLLVSEPGRGTIAKAVQVLKGNTSKAAHEESGVAESFWLPRYFDHNVRNHSGFVTQLRYIHRNPVKRGLCSKPEEYPWSSFRGWATGEAGIVEIENEWTARRREIASLRASNP